MHVTREDAAAYAAWAGGRLPTEAEWEFAAGARGAVEDDRGPPENANTWQGLFPVADLGSDGFAGVAPVASYRPNALGLYDMLGNVWEWISTPYAPSHSVRDRELAGPFGLDRSQPGVPVGTVKGGSFLCSDSYCRRYRTTARHPQDLAFGTSHTGFRVVRAARD